MGYLAGLYMRLSREDGTHESAGIEGQRLLLRSFAAQQNLAVAEEYVDDGYSGTNYRRPAFERMLRDIEMGKINTVLIKDLSRLGRNYLASGELTEVYFPSRNVRLIAVNDGYDSETGEDDMAPFRHVINEMYARDISKKIRSSLYAKMREGQYVGSFPPYGYRKSEDNKNRLQIDWESASIVRRIFDMAAKGASTRYIAEQLNHEEIPIPLDYRRIREGKEGMGREWTASGICKILRNRVYLGHTEQGKSRKPNFRSGGCVPRKREDWIVVEHTHDPLIDEETFKQVQKRSRKKYTIQVQ